MTDLWTRLRQETPGAAHIAHFNNAGAALQPSPVIAAIKEHIDRETYLGGYEAAAAVIDRIENAYRAIGAAMGADARNIALVSSATDAFARALSSIPFERGDVIVAPHEDYASNRIQLLSAARRFGLEIATTPRMPDGAVDCEALGRLLAAGRARLVTAVHMNTSSGRLVDVAAIGRICAAHGALYLVDGCQTFGWMRLDAAAIGCDFLCATSRKFMRGPRGMGALFVSDRVLDAGLEPLFVDLRGADLVDAAWYRQARDAKRFEDWEFSIANLLGFGAAAGYALQIGLANVEARVRERARAVRAAIEASGDWRVIDSGADGPIIPVHAATRNGQAAQIALAQRGVNVAFLPRAWAPTDKALAQAGWALRISPHYYTCDEDIDRLAGALKETA